jgi:MoaA/NifB/PqqE/SkfB family radical SAM enzyme
MISKIKNKIIGFIQKNHQISPSLTRFPISDTFWKAGIHKLLFCRREPLLNDGIYGVVAYAHKHHIVTSISTNFNYLPGNSAERLITSGLDILILSIDGALKEVYAKYRASRLFSSTGEVKDPVTICMKCPFV